MQDSHPIEITTIVGLILGGVAIGGGALLHGSALGVLWEPSAFVIVIVGTVAAIATHTPLTVLRDGVKLLPWAFKPPAVNARGVLDDIVEWSQNARKQGLLSLEQLAEAQPDPFRKKGLQLLADGTEAAALRTIMETEIEQIEQHDMKGARVFEWMGIYSPTLGICGAVLGLIAVMTHLDQPAKLGAGIAAAFTATIYGVALANLVYLPISAKLKTVIAGRSHTQELLVEGWVAIAHGENPHNIEVRLSAYLK